MERLVTYSAGLVKPGPVVGLGSLKKRAGFRLFSGQDLTDLIDSVLYRHNTYCIVGLKLRQSQERALTYNFEDSN